MLYFYQDIDPYYALNLKMAVVVNPEWNGGGICCRNKKPTALSGFLLMLGFVKS
jgi:hypothetical protein